MADIESATIISGGEVPVAAGGIGSSIVSKSPKAKKSSSKTAVAGGVAKKPKAKPNHPPTSEMVQSAIKALKERGGSSLQAIKKYISATYKIDADKLSPFIKKYLKGAVTSGQLVQTKGKGASGSFKISSAALKTPKTIKKSSDSEKKSVKKSIVKKSATANKKPKSVTKKQAVGAKKLSAAAAKKSASSDKKKSSAATGKSVKKSNVGGVKSAPKQKSTKPKADAPKKLKTPKPKKTVSTKKATAKK